MDCRILEDNEGGMSPAVDVMHVPVAADVVIGDSVSGQRSCRQKNGEDGDQEKESSVRPSLLLSSRTF